MLFPADTGPQLRLERLCRGNVMDGAIEQTTNKEPMLVRTVRIELAFPLDDRTWEEIGTGHGRLGALRSQVHRLLNAGVVGLFANNLAPKDSIKPNALSYIKREIGDIERWAESKNVDHLKSLRLPGNITDALQSAVNDDVKKYWKDKGKTRIPSAKEGAPIPVRDGGWKITLDADKRFTFSVKLWDGRDPSTWVRFAVRASKGMHYGLLEQIATGYGKPGSCEIVRDVNRKKWYAMLAFSTPRPPKPDRNPNIVLAVNRGRHNLLYAAANVAGKARVVIPGEQILRMKQRTEAMRLERKRHMRIIGDGAKGHGKGRRYREYERIGDYEARFVHTACQQAAAAVVAYAERVGASRVLIEDFTTISAEDKRYVPSWPWYQLKSAVAWACQKSGVELIEMGSEYISSLCPLCGHIDDRAHSIATGTFKCSRCEFQRDADLVACLNMLDANGEDISSWRKGFEDAEAFARAIKRGDDAEDCERSSEEPSAKKRNKGGTRKPGRKIAK